jgi:hypothetical protein
MLFRKYIQKYLEGQGAIIPGANHISKPLQGPIAAPVDTTKLMRESFKQKP